MIAYSLDTNACIAIINGSSARLRTRLDEAVRSEPTTSSSPARPRRGITVVTANTREFERIEGLMWEDWA